MPVQLTAAAAVLGLHLLSFTTRTCEAREAISLSALATELPAPEWKDDRDLSTLFEESDDRVALARLVIQECKTNRGLSDTARVDGLRIAGHICYRDGAPTDAIEAFTEMNTVADAPRWKAEALRMLAQLSMDGGAVCLPGL